MKKMLKKVMPEKVWEFLRARKQWFTPIKNSLAYFQGGVDLILGKRDLSTPPLWLMFDGPADYKEFKNNGRQYLDHYVNLCGLKPNEVILDVGSGIGRKTFPLTNYLSQDGEYWGIELNKVGVDWCKSKISKRYPNFHFQLIDVYNKHYNPKGSQKASAYVFPFPDNLFDFVTLGSIFTHMLPDDVDNYLNQIARVLKPSGRCLITYFLLNKEALDLVARGKATLDFKYKEGVYRIIDLLDPEGAVSYEENFILGLYQKYGLTVNKPIYYGSWCKRSSYLNYQDIIVATKEPKEP
jgi:ubiquinone/menaquinone biosynthesis C-methylase UbiE